jgi:hypothetical protein
MSSSSETRDMARRKARNLFERAEARDSAVRQEMEKERNAAAVKTAKLRALRLAKEAEEKIESDKIAAGKAAAGAAAAARKTAKAARKAS